MTMGVSWICEPGKESSKSNVQATWLLYELLISFWC
jgi:hypothetical protein